MRSEMSAMEIAARLILGDDKARKLTALPVTIDGGCTYKLVHFGQPTGDSNLASIGGTNGSIEINSRAFHSRLLMVFILEPRDEQQMQPSERELIGDALVQLEQHLKESKP